MNQHPYLRAYMAGIVVPTLFLLVGMTAFTVARYVCHIPLPIERVIVFPLTIVPNLWGLWNIIYVALLSRRHVSVGAFGALLPFLLAPGGWLIAHLFELPIPRVAPFLFPIGVVLYYILWKHVVGRLNAIIGVA
ncbi:MAG: hypothetical protein AABO58_19785 [Acidobacteriota bacterium]